MKQKYIVAVKDVSTGEIKPGKVLGQFRKREDAWQARFKLAEMACLRTWKVGIFFNGKCLD